MKNDPYFKLIAASIILGLLLALVSTHVHAAVPLPPVHVTAKAPHWQMVLIHPPLRAGVPNVNALRAVMIPMPPAFPALQVVNFHLGS